MNTTERNICTACGTHYLFQDRPLEVCPICNDDRQFIPEKGQSWISNNELLQSYSVVANKLHDQLYELKTTPTFGIGQRALLLLAPGGNLLWDCIGLLNEQTIAFIKSKGGLRAIAFSHPHYYSNMNEWAEVFNCPIYIHQNDEAWVFNRGNRVQLWEGVEKELWDGVKIINTGGHFPGSCILSVPFLSPEGSLFLGDTFAVSPNKKHISAMYSYPNRVPLPLAEMQRLRKQMSTVEFDTVYGYAEFQNIHLTAKEVFENSISKYI
jgi:hypothetical protein